LKIEFFLNHLLFIGYFKENSNINALFILYLQGRSCQFRHEPSALGSQTTCPRWQQGKCFNFRCNLRHAILNNQRRHSDSRPRFARTSSKADASEFQVKNIEQIRREKLQRFGQPAEPLKAIDCNVTNGPHCNLSNSQLDQNDWPMKDETICEVTVENDALVTELWAKEQALNLHDVSNTQPVKHVWTDEEWQIFDSLFLKPAIVNDPAALAEYLAPRLEERKKPKKRQRIIYVDAPCEEIETCPKKGRWDFDCLFP
jgi:Zinc-finger containing family